MFAWSRYDAIEMEMRHILTGEKLVASQKALIARLVKSEHNSMLLSATELLDLLSDILKFSRCRLKALKAEDTQ